MALHTGTAELRDNDYFGQPLNRVARLLGAGHGGQVLISTATQELTRDTLMSKAGLKPLGEHRLRDLGRPEPVFQLLHPDLPFEFPPLKSLDNPNLPNNLPIQVTSFIGREKEIEAVKIAAGQNTPPDAHWQRWMRQDQAWAASGCGCIRNLLGWRMAGGTGSSG